jgi:hypothetical protein
MQSHRLSRWSREIEIPWCGRARRRCARDRSAAPENKITINTALVHAPPSHRASQTMQSHRMSRWSREIELPWCGRARRRCARDRSAAPANEVALNTALVHAPPSHRASQTMQSHRLSRWSRDIELPWCGRARRRCARDRSAAPANDITLNTALVHAPHPTEHLKPCSRIDYHDGAVGKPRDIELPWCARARRPCNGRPSAAPAHKITLNTALVHAPPPTEHLKPCSRIDYHTGRGISNYLGVAVLGVRVLGTAVLHPQTRSLSTQASITRLLPQSISNHAVA